MEAPKKIYLQVCGDCPINDCEDCKFEEDNVTWCKDRIFDNDIEYTRTDAFIERIHELLSSRIDYITYYHDKTEFVNEIIEDISEDIE